MRGNLIHIFAYLLPIPSIHNVETCCLVHRTELQSDVQHMYSCSCFSEKIILQYTGQLIILTELPKVERMEIILYSFVLVGE